MNGRFSRLELGRGAETAETSAQVVGTPVRTETDDATLAVEAYRKGQFESALRSYTKALGRNRALISAWVGQVQMLVELGEYAEARLWADKSLELFKNNGELLAGKSRACLRMGDRRAAMACSDASLKSPGSSALRWQARGEAMVRENGARARDCFEKSLAEPGADWFDRVVIARAYLFHDKPAAAMEYAGAAVTMRAAHAYCWLVLGQCQEATGLAGKAYESYTRCLELESGMSEAKHAISGIANRPRGVKLLHWIGGVFKR